MSVVDASLLIDVLLGLPAGRPWRRWVAETDRLAAPDCLGVEFGRHMRRHVLSGALDERSADDALAVMRALQIELYPTLPLLTDALAVRDTFTFDDALYVALASRLGEPLATNDRRLARAAADAGITVVAAPA